MRTWFDCFDTPLRTTQQPTRLRRTHQPLRRAALAIVAAAMAASLIACGGGKAVQIVKSAHADGYPNKTIGEAFEAFFGSPKWEEGVPEDDELREQGITLVNFTGKMMYADKEVEAVIQFHVKKDDETFTFEAFELNGIPQDLLTTAVVFEKIFADDTADASDVSGGYDSDEYGTDEVDDTAYNTAPASVPTPDVDSLISDIENAVYSLQMMSSEVAGMVHEGASDEEVESAEESIAASIDEVTAKVRAIDANSLTGAQATRLQNAVEAITELAGDM